MGRASGRHGRGKDVPEGFQWRNKKESDFLESLYVDGRIILNRC